MARSRKESAENKSGFVANAKSEAGSTSISFPEKLGQLDRELLPLAQQRIELMDDGSMILARAAFEPIRANRRSGPNNR